MPKKKKQNSSKEKITPVIEEVVEEKVAVEPEKETDLPLKKTVSIKKQGFSFKLMLFLTIITAIVTGLLAGGFYVYFTGISKLKPESEDETNYPTPVAVATSVPQSSPDVSQNETVAEENVDVSLYKIQILNGSGKIGEASKVEKILLADGYEVANVGNASSYNYKETAVVYKNDVPTLVIANLKDLLSKAYDVAEEDGDNLADSSAYDIVITVGSQ